jgi:UDP-N-acetylglucosamine diphosphorylase/glucosamine-1-phosphate N-acetyltransferase
MKAFILAAGEGTRMRPLTANIPKPLLPVANKPFLIHTIDALSAAGIKEATILLGWKGHRIRDFLAHQPDLGVAVDFEEQEKRLGTAHAIGLAKNHVSGSFLSINGDVVVSSESIAGLLDFHKRVGGTVMAIAEVGDPSRFGVVEMNDDKVVGLEEKPSKPKSNLINAGICIFSPDIFDLIAKTPASVRGEFEITDTLQMLIAKGGVFGHRLEEEWIDVGSSWDLLKANEILLKGLKTKVEGEVDEHATLIGSVQVGPGTKILRGAHIQGPVIIGKDCEIGPNCRIRPSTYIGDKCKIGNGSEVKNSIFMEGSRAPHINYVGDSILGERVNLGAGTNIANLRLDGRPVSVTLKGKTVDTGLRKLGAIIGDDVRIGINASIDAGTIVGEETFIGMGAVVRGTIAPRSRIH